MSWLCPLFPVMLLIFPLKWFVAWHCCRRWGSTYWSRSTWSYWMMADTWTDSTASATRSQLLNTTPNASTNSARKWCSSSRVFCCLKTAMKAIFVLGSYYDAHRYGWICLSQYTAPICSTAVHVLLVSQGGFEAEVFTDWMPFPVARPRAL